MALHPIRTASTARRKADEPADQLEAAPAEPRPVPAPEPQARKESPGPETPATPSKAPTVPAAAAPPKRNSLRRRLMIGAAALAVLAGVAYGGYYWTVGRFFVSTDDAYVGAEMAQLSARVAARVAEVHAAANQRIAKGDPIVTLDQGDFQLAVDQAEARLSTQQAAVTRIGTQVEAARAAATQARAQLEAARADLVRAEADFERTAPLAARQVTSQATLDAARAARDRARASLAAFEAGVQAADSNIAVLEAQKTEAERTAKETEVSVAKAKRDLEATIVRAPVDGVIGNKSVQVGDYVTPGKRLAALVPLDEVYIDANYKETQLARICPGESAHVTVDAVGGDGFDARVASLAPASGSQFSLLPPDNATGNFTKIVQRVPVRLAVPREIVEQGKLRPGLSVVVTIDTRTGDKPASNKPAGAK